MWVIIEPVVETLEGTAWKGHAALPVLTRGRLVRTDVCTRPSRDSRRLQRLWRGHSTWWARPRGVTRVGCPAWKEVAVCVRGGPAVSLWGSEDPRDSMSQKGSVVGFPLVCPGIHCACTVLEFPRPRALPRTQSPPPPRPPGPSGSSSCPRALPRTWLPPPGSL